MNHYRNIMIAATNACLENGLSLDPSNDPLPPAYGHAPKGNDFKCMMFGEPASVSYEYHGWDEVLVRLKWSLSDNKHGCRLILAAWLERRTGAWLQGNGASYIGRDYVGQGVVSLLKSFPLVEPNGYLATGKFYC